MSIEEFKRKDKGETGNKGLKCHLEVKTLRD